MPASLPRLLPAICLALPLVLHAAEARQGEAEALRWLARMQEALAELAYRGEFSYFRDGRLSSLSVAHGRVGGEVHERLVHLDGPHREILRVGDRVSCFMKPGDPMLAHMKRVPAGPFARAFIPGDGASGAMLPPSYEARVAGTERIAGEGTMRIDVVPADRTRYGYRLWLQDPTAMPLRAELVDADARPLEIFQFVRIEIGERIDPRAFASTGAEGLVRHDLRLTGADPGAAPARDHEWEAAWLPEGFAMAAASRRPTPARSAPVQTLRYSDGIASLSIFVEPPWAEAAWQRSRRRGATSAVMREVEVEGGDRYLVTVVGEVPMDTAERVAVAVRPRG